VKRLAVASTAERLAALEQQFLEIAKMTKALGRKLDQVAETVRVAVDELDEARKSVARGSVKTPARRTRPANGTSS
jgi:hypothetical protein